MKKLIFVTLTVLLIFACEATLVEADPCASIVCERGGTCIDGNCDCPPAFTGPTCNIPKPARYCKLLGIEVLSYPLRRPNGSNWDSDGSRPDVGIQIYVNDNLIMGTNYVVNATFGAALQPSNQHYQINVGDLVKLEVVDVEENLSYEVMGSYSFFPKDYDPLSYRFDLYNPNTEHKIRLRVYVEWVF
jgi:hypothetical protein